MELVLLLHEVEVSVIEESLGREVAILEWDLCKHLLVTLTQDELPEHHELLSREIDVYKITQVSIEDKQATYF